MARPGSIVVALLCMLAGPLVWAAHFLVVYGGHASLCLAADRLPLVELGTLPWLLTIATGTALLLVAVLAWRSPLLVRRLLPQTVGTGENRFLARVTRLLALLSGFGLLCSATAMLLLPLCAQLR